MMNRRQMFKKSLWAGLGVVFFALTEVAEAKKKSKKGRNTTRNRKRKRTVKHTGIVKRLGENTADKSLGEDSFDIQHSKIQQMHDDAMHALKESQNKQ